MIPTAEEYVNNRFTKQISGDITYPDIYASKESIIESHILFAKLCVQAALKAVASNDKILRLEEYSDDWYVDEERVINSYPLENIK